MGFQAFGGIEIDCLKLLKLRGRQLGEDLFRGLHGQRIAVSFAQMHFVRTLLRKISGMTEA